MKSPAPRNELRRSDGDRVRMWAFINGMEAVVRRYQRKDEAEIDRLIKRMREEEGRHGQ